MNRKKITQCTKYICLQTRQLLIVISVLLLISNELLAKDTPVYCENTTLNLVTIYSFNITGPTATSTAVASDFACSMNGSPAKTINPASFKPDDYYSFTDAITPTAITYKMTIYALVNGVYTIVTVTPQITITINIEKIPTNGTLTMPNYCSNATSVALSGGNPAGGTYSGTNVAGGYFNPSLGAQTITYTYTDGVCVSSTSAITPIVAPATVHITNVPANACINASSITISTDVSTLTNVVYSGPGVSGTTFSPATAGYGSKTISLTATDNNQCATTGSLPVTVIAPAAVNINSVPPICVSANPITLSVDNITVTNGVFTGPGTSISGNYFTPALAGSIGNQVIGFTGKDNNQCVCTATPITINILDKPRPALPVLNYKVIMCKNSSQKLILSNRGKNNVQWYNSSNTLLSSDTSYTVTNTGSDIVLKIKYIDANYCTSDLKNITMLNDNVTAGYTLGSNSVKQYDKIVLSNTSSSADTCIWSMFISNTKTLEGFPIGSGPTKSPSIYCNITGTKDLKLVAISPNNCRDSVTRTITVTAGSSVKNNKTLDIKVYPNPISNVVNIDLTGKNKDASLIILNVNGVKLIEKHIKIANEIESIDLSTIVAGSYLLLVTMDGDSQSYILEKK